MDNSNVPTIDLNIDPNMIAAQDDSPQAMPTNPQTVPTPTTPSFSRPGIIDITPGADETLNSTPVSNHIDVVPLSEPKILDITPQTNSTDPLVHLSDVNPEPVAIVPLAPPIPSITTPVAEETTTQAPSPTTQSSPLAEDPDLVKLIK